MVSRVTNRNATRQRQNVPPVWHQSWTECTVVPVSARFKMRSGTLDEEIQLMSELALAVQSNVDGFEAAH